MTSGRTGSSGPSGPTGSSGRGHFGQAAGHGRLAQATGSVVAMVCTLLLGAFVTGDRGPTGPDTVFARFAEERSAGETLSQVLVFPTEPAVVLTMLGVVVLFRVREGHHAGAVFAVAAPALAVAANTWVLKPGFGRHYGDHLAYPSGHTVSLVAVLAVAGVLCRTSRARWWLVCLGTVVVGGAAIGMADLGYHYVTDVVGGAAFGLAVTIGLATVWRPRPDPRTSPGR